MQADGALRVGQQHGAPPPQSPHSACAGQEAGPIQSEPGGPGRAGPGSRRADGGGAWDAEGVCARAGQDLVLVVNDLLAAFDGLRTRHDVYKVENIAEGEHRATRMRLGYGSG